MSIRLLIEVKDASIISFSKTSKERLLSLSFEVSKSQRSELFRILFEIDNV